MEIVIKIPKEFENHFNSDKFEDSLQRVRFDIHKAMLAKRGILSGNYEIETLDMLTEAFLKSTPLPKGHGRLIDADKLQHKINNDKREAFSKHEVWLLLSTYNDNLLTIIEAEKKVR